MISKVFKIMVKEGNTFQPELTLCLWCLDDKQPKDMQFRFEDFRWREFSPLEKGRFLAASKPGLRKYHHPRHDRRHKIGSTTGWILSRRRTPLAPKCGLYSVSLLAPLRLFIVMVTCGVYHYMKRQIVRVFIWKKSGSHGAVPFQL